MSKKNRKSKQKRSFLKHEFSIPLILFVFALAIRLVYLFQSRAYDPQFDYPVIDALFHHQWAQQIIGGDFFGTGVFFRAPLYPYFLALIYKIFGVSIFTVKFVQALIGAVCAGLTYFLGRDIFGKTAGIIAGTMMVLFAPAVFYEGELLLDPLAMFLVLSSAMVTLRAITKTGASLYIVAGSLWGLSAVCRPTTLVMLFVVVVIILTKTLTVSKIRWRNIGLLFLGAALVILPVTIRNYVVGKDFALVASQGGINFYIGNNPYADGTTAAVPELTSHWEYLEAVDLAEKTLGRRLKPSEVSAYYFKRGLEFWVDEPLTALNLLFRKSLFFWSDYEIPNNRSFYFQRQYPSVLKYLPVTFGVIAPLSILGLVLIFLRSDWRKPEILFLAGIIATHWFTHVLFFINGRFRLPIMPFLICFGAAAAVSLFRTYSDRLFKKLAVMIVILIISFTLVFTDFREHADDEIAAGFYSVGLTYMDRRELEKAEESYYNAKTRDPGMFQVNLELAGIAFYRNDLAAAENYLLQELKNNPFEVRALNNLSILKRLQGEPIIAADFAHRALECNPSHEEPYINLCLALELHGNPDSVRIIVDNALKYYPHFYQLRLYSGALFINEGDTLNAIEEFQKLTLVNYDLLVEYMDLDGVRKKQRPHAIALEQIKEEARRRLSELGVRE